MPIVRIDIQAGKSTAYKRDILRSVRSAITVALGVANERIVQRVVETPAENIDATDIQSDRLTVIEISMLPGRPPALLQAMYAEIISQLGQRPGIHHNDIDIIVHGPAAECFTIGGVMQCMLPGPDLTAEEEEAVLEDPIQTAIVGLPDAADPADIADQTEGAVSSTAETPSGTAQPATATHIWTDGR